MAKQKRLATKEDKTASLIRMKVNFCVNPFCKWFRLPQVRFEGVLDKPYRFILASNMNDRNKRIGCNPDLLGNPGIVWKRQGSSLFKLFCCRGKPASGYCFTITIWLEGSQVTMALRPSPMNLNGTITRPSTMEAGTSNVTGVPFTIASGLSTES